MRIKNCLSAGLTAGLLLVTAFGLTASAQSTFKPNGPYKVVEEMDPSLPNHTVYRPEDVKAVKGKLPVVAFGNGGCANQGNAFEHYLAEIASYGFLVVANGPIKPTMPGWPPKPGAKLEDMPAPPPDFFRMEQSKTSQLYETMDWAKTQNGDASSRYAGKLDVSKIAVSGQSCGGLQAIEAASDPRVKAAVIFNSGIIRNPAAMPGLPSAPPAAAGAPPMPPLMLPGSVEGLKKVRVPMIYIIGGETDIAYKNAEADFADITVAPVFNANLTDVGHVGTIWFPDGGKFAEVATKWLLWQLKRDQKAGATFRGPNCGLCSNPDWKVKSKNLN